MTDAAFLSRDRTNLSDVFERRFNRDFGLGERSLVNANFIQLAFESSIRAMASTNSQWITNEERLIKEVIVHMRRHRLTIDVKLHAGRMTHSIVRRCNMRPSVEWHRRNGLESNRIIEPALH